MTPVMRIMVTGGAGFVGSHLCERLVRAGHEVFCVDNLSTGSRANVANLLHEPNFRLIRHDVARPLHLQVDQIYNLACPASPAHYQLDPLQTLRTSVYGAANMLALAKQMRARILQASTSEVYGDPHVHPQVETYWGNVNPFGVRACYDEGKRCAETLCFDYHRTYGVDIRVARIFNTFGPRMQADDGRVVSNFIVQAIRGDPITIYGGGCQTRSFCYVDDMVEGLVRLMNCEAIHQPVNLGNPVETTVAELATRVVALAGSKSAFVFQALPEDDPVRRCPAIGRARAMLGWEPAVTLEQGLIRTIEHFRAVLAGPAAAAAATLAAAAGAVVGPKPADVEALDARRPGAVLPSADDFICPAARVGALR